jgi:hypothetical protein
MKNTSKRIEYILKNQSQSCVARFFENGDFQRFDESIELYTAYKEFLVMMIAQYDPTPNKKFTQWLVREYERGAFDFSACIYKAHCYLDYFDRYKQFLKEKDINHYSYHDLIAVVEGIKQISFGRSNSKALSKREFKDYLLSSRHIELVTSSNNFSGEIFSLKTFEGGFYYSHPHKWCIYLEEIFDRYLKNGPLLFMGLGNHSYLFHGCFDYSFIHSDEYSGWIMELANSSNDLVSSFSNLEILGIKPAQKLIGLGLYLMLKELALQNNILLYRDYKTPEIRHTQSNTEIQVLSVNFIALNNNKNASYMQAGLHKMVVELEQFFECDFERV